MTVLTCALLLMHDGRSLPALCRDSWFQKLTNLYLKVGDPVSEHKSWGRPDTIPPRRPAYSINKKNPGSDLAGETAAALAAVSLALRRAALGIRFYYTFFVRTIL